MRLLVTSVGPAKNFQKRLPRFHITFSSPEIKIFCADEKKLKVIENIIKLLKN